MQSESGTVATVQAVVREAAKLVRKQRSGFRVEVAASSSGLDPTGIASDETPDRDLERLYAKVLGIANAAVFHDVDWKLLAVLADHDESSTNLIAYRWRTNADYWLIVVNLGSTDAQGRCVSQTSSNFPRAIH